MPLCGEIAELSLDRFWQELSAGCDTPIDNGVTVRYVMGWLRTPSSFQGVRVMLLKCPDCHRDVDCSSRQESATCPICGRHFAVKGRKAKRIEEVIDVLKHGHYGTPSSGHYSGPDRPGRL